MPNLDGGHYFFTGLVPICNDGYVEHEGLKSSPIHVVREALESLPTALQSHSTEKIGIQSPFARSLRTHFARFVVLDQPFFNGRDAADAIVTAVRGTNLLTAQAMDDLPCPYLLVMIDFDPADSTAANEPRSFFEELWGLMSVELTEVFRYAYGFASVVNAASFASMMIDCQIETTMPFNDYWIGKPPLKSVPKLALIAILLLAFALPVAAAWELHWPLGLAALVAAALLLAGVSIDYAWIMARGRKSLPAAPDATLRHVLKALYLQQTFTRFVAAQQRRDPDTIGAAFRAFLAEHRPRDLERPTQPPAVIRSQFDEAVG
jgi:pimeloyl-ACP methyl ester carboxylesterase